MARKAQILSRAGKAAFIVFGRAEATPDLGSERKYRAPQT
jgi:hypothetical protein